MLKCTSIKYYGNKVNVMQIEFGNICPETRGKISHSFFFGGFLLPRQGRLTLLDFFLWHAHVSSKWQEQRYQGFTGALENFPGQKENVYMYMYLLLAMTFVRVCGVSHSHFQEGSRRSYKNPMR